MVNLLQADRGVVGMKERKEKENKKRRGKGREKPRKVAIESQRNQAEM